MVKKIRKIILFQKSLLSISPEILCDKSEWLCSFVFCIISVPAAIVSAITMFIFRIYYAEDSIFVKASKDFEILNLYLSGYVLFIIIILGFMTISLGIGLPLRFFVTGNLNDVLNEMLVISMKDIVEMVFCICFYQFSVFYMVCTKNGKGFTKLKKRSEFLILVFLSGIIFFFVRVWILEYHILLYFMFSLLFVGAIILPIISCKWKT